MMTYMGKMVFNGSVVGAAFAIVLAILGFASKELFDDSRGATRDFRVHQVSSEKSVAELRAHDALIDQKMSQIEIKVTEMAADIKEILRRTK